MKLKLLKLFFNLKLGWLLISFKLKMLGLELLKRILFFLITLGILIGYLILVSGLLIILPPIALIYPSALQKRKIGSTIPDIYLRGLGEFVSKEPTDDEFIS